MPDTFEIAARRIALAAAIACGSQLAVADDASNRIILRQRNDPNAQADIEASRAAGLLPRLFPDAAVESREPEEAATSLTIGATPENDQPDTSAAENSADVEAAERRDAPAAAAGDPPASLPKYPRGTAGGTVPEADDNATTPPALGSARSQRDPAEPAAFFATPRTVSTTVQPAAAVEPAAVPLVGGAYGQIVYDQYCRPVVIACGSTDVIRILPQTSPAIAQPPKAEPAESPAKASEGASGVSRFESQRPTLDEGNWSDEAIVRRAAEHSGGALEVSEPAEGDAAEPTPTVSDISRRESLRPTETSTIQALAPPKYSFEIDAPSTAAMTVGSPPPTIRYASMQVDAEAAAVPSLPPLDSSVAPAAFQDALPPGFGPPSYGLPQATAPGTAYPSAVPSAIPAPGTIVTPLPSNTLPQYNNNAPAYDSAPTYPQAPRVVSEEPFVTGAPCQFDASYMVQPVSYAASVCPPAVAAPLAAAATVPGFIPSSVILPNQAPGLYSAQAAGVNKRPLFGFGQENYNVVVGRGIIGQPVAYVPGQPVRNFFRYIFP